MKLISMFWIALCSLVHSDWLRVKQICIFIDLISWRGIFLFSFHTNIWHLKAFWPLRYVAIFSSTYLCDFMITIKRYDTWVGLLILVLCHRGRGGIISSWDTHFLRSHCVNLAQTSYHLHQKSHSTCWIRITSLSEDRLYVLPVLFWYNGTHNRTKIFQLILVTSHIWYIKVLQLCFLFFLTHKHSLTLYIICTFWCSSESIASIPFILTW